MASHPNKDPDIYQGGQNKFFRYPSPDEFSNYDLEAGLIAVRGYYSSVRFSTERILLNLNSQCTPFYKVMNARELVQEFLQSRPRDWSAALESFLWKLRVKTSYMRASDGTPIDKDWSIIGFAHKKTKFGMNDKIELRNATEINFKLEEKKATISVKEYFLTGEFSLRFGNSKLTGP